MSNDVTNKCKHAIFRVLWANRKDDGVQIFVEPEAFPEEIANIARDSQAEFLVCKLGKANATSMQTVAFDEVGIAFTERFGGSLVSAVATWDQILCIAHDHDDGNYFRFLRSEAPKSKEGVNLEPHQEKDNVIPFRRRKTSDLN